MEPNDNQFTGTPASNTNADSITFAQPKSGPWKVISIASIIIIILLAAGCVYFFLMMGNEANKAADAEDRADSLNTQLQAYHEATGTENPADVKPLTLEVDFVPFYEALASAQISTNTLIFIDKDNSFIRPSTDPRYEIASLATTSDFGATTQPAYFYHELAAGSWHYSTFSTQNPTNPDCTKVTDAEIAAFDGIFTCPTPQE